MRAERSGGFILVLVICELEYSANCWQLGGRRLEEERPPPPWILPPGAQDQEARKANEVALLEVGLF